MNTLKTTFLMVLMTGILLVAGAMFGGKTGMTFMLLVSLGMNLMSYWYSDKIVLRMYGAREVGAADAPDLFRMVQGLADNANLPMPRVYIMDNDSPNAFATGRNPEHGVVAVTTGIMRLLTYEELSGVVAHELAHIKNRDTLISTVVASLAGAITWIAHMAQWGAMFGIGRSDDEEGSSMLELIVLAVVAPLAATLVQLGISRSREYAADASGGAIAGNPLALARALQKIEYYAKNKVVMSEATPATAHLFIVNPFSGAGGWVKSLFSTHPATSERVARLEQQARQ